MNKTFAVYFVTGLQLLSLRLGSSAVHYDFLRTTQIYAAKEISPNSPERVAYGKPAAQCDSVTDIDGNVYHAVKIGKQCWLKENLKTTHFRDGSPIAEMESLYDWPQTANHNNRAITGTPAWCYYQNMKENNYTYGKLYNWYIVTDQHNVCPTGWHLPSDDEFQLLSDFLGGDEKSGDHIKATELWGERAADNTSGFTAIPAGIRYRGGNFDRGGAEATGFWTCTSGDQRNISLCRILYYGGSNLGRHIFDKRSGLSVRCVAD